MTLSDNNRESCKVLIAKIRDDVASVLEVLSKPNVDVKRASDLCKGLSNSVACIHTILTLSLIRDLLEKEGSDAES